MISLINCSKFFKNSFIAVFGLFLRLFQSDNHCYPFLKVTKAFTKISHKIYDDKI